MKSWKQMIQDRDLVVGILGLGYVGLPLAREFATRQVKVLGFDVDSKKVKTLNTGRSIIKNVPHHQIKAMVKAGTFSATHDMARLREVHAVLICVPTPLTENREPDMQFVVGSCQKRT